MRCSARHVAVVLVALVACGPAAGPRFARTTPPPLPAVPTPGVPVVAAVEVGLQAAPHQAWAAVDADVQQERVRLAAPRPVDVVARLGPIRSADVDVRRAPRAPVVTALASLQAAAATAGANGVVDVRCYRETAHDGARIWCEGEAARLATGGAQPAALVALPPRSPSRWYGDGKFGLGATGTTALAALHAAIGRGGAEVALHFTEDAYARPMVGVGALATTERGALSYRAGVSVMRLFRSLADLRDGDVALMVTPVLGVAHRLGRGREPSLMVEARVGWTFTGDDVRDDDLRGPFAMVLVGLSTR